VLLPTRYLLLTSPVSAEKGNLKEPPGFLLLEDLSSTCEGELEVWAETRGLYALEEGYWSRVGCD
jgi:hypothetical protein